MIRIVAASLLLASPVFAQTATVVGRTARTTAGVPVISAADMAQAFRNKVDTDGGVLNSPTLNTPIFNGSSRFGATTDWVSPILGGSLATTGVVAAISPSSAGGVFGATRTSDNGSLGGQGSYGLFGFAINDYVNARGGASAYAAYLEARRYAGVNGVTQGIESAVVDASGTAGVSANPFTVTGNGQTINALFGCGRQDVSGNSNCTTAILIGGSYGQTNGAGNYSGIMFGPNSLVATGHNGYAHPIGIDMPRSTSFVWANATDGNVVSFIRSDTNYPTGAGGGGANGGGGGSLVFTDGGLILGANQTPGASIEFRGTQAYLIGNVNVSNALIVQQSASVAGTFGVQGLLSFFGGMMAGGLGTYANDAAAAAATPAVPINGVYINATTHAMTVRTS